MENLIIFLKLLILELLSQKWFKASIFSFLTIFIIEFRDDLIHIATTFKIPTLILFFVVYFLRFLISELIPKQSIYNKNYQVLKLVDIQTQNNCQTISGKEPKEISEHITWQFKDEMFKIPSINIESKKTKTKYEHNIIRTYIELFSESIGNSSAVFELRIKHNLISEPDDLSIYDFFSDLEIVAVSTHFDSDSFYQIILNFLSIKIKKNRFLKHLV